MMKSVILAETAVAALSACSSQNLDANDPAVRTGPQVQNPWGDAPGGKVATDRSNSGATTPVIIDDSGVPAAANGGSIFEAL